MSKVQDDYWEECVAQAAEECEAALTREQVAFIAGAVQGCHENYGMAFYSPPAGEHYRSEIATLERKIKALTDKAEQDEWFWSESYIKAKGYSPDRVSVRRDGNFLELQERR